MGRPFSFYLSLGGLVLIVTLTLFADWIAPYASTRERRSESFHPPTKIHFFDASGRFYARPFVYRTRAVFDSYYRRRYEEDTSEKYFIQFGGPKLFQVKEPAAIYLFGTDSRGRDLFSRILFGARTSLSIGILGAMIATGIGLLMGGVSGYFGGSLDEILMRISEFFIMVPGFYFLLALRSVLPPDLGSGKVYVLIIVILSMIGWGGMARVIRGMVVSIRENEFVLAARVLGRRHGEILARHILPHTWNYLLVVFSVSVPGYILGESALSVLGLGIQDPHVSWGNLFTEALSIAHLSLHPWVLTPGFFIFFTSLCFHALADSLQGGWRVAENRILQ